MQLGQSETTVATRTRWPDRLCLPLRFDAAALRADLDRLEGTEWTPHFVTANYRGAWDILPLRHPAGAVHPILRAVSHPGVVAWEDSELLAACPAFRDALRSLCCPIGAARLMRLRSGAEILAHRDPDLDAERGQLRLHLPIMTSPAAAFFLNDEAVSMSVGSLWYLRLSDPHRAINAGDRDRIHLVIDVQVDGWMADLLDEAALAAAA